MAVNTAECTLARCNTSKFLIRIIMIIYYYDDKKLAIITYGCGRKEANASMTLLKSTLSEFFFNTHYK